MASFQGEFGNSSNLRSGSDGAYLTEIAKEDLKKLKSKIAHHFLETDNLSACILHQEGQSAKIMMFGESKVQLGDIKSRRSKPAKKLLVKRVPNNSDKEHLQMFFEYEKGQGGGPVKQVTLNDDRSAIIEFEEARSVDVVLQKAPIKMLGEVVEVSAFVPYLDDDEVIESISVDGLPVSLSKEIAEMSLEQGISIGKESQNVTTQGDRELSVKQNINYQEIFHSECVEQVGIMDEMESVESELSELPDSARKQKVPAWRDQRMLKKGDRVRVKRSVSNPRYGWKQSFVWGDRNRVTHDSIGTVRDVEYNVVTVKFLSHQFWKADPDELEIVH